MKCFIHSNDLLSYLQIGRKEYEGFLILVVSLEAILL